MSADTTSRRWRLRGYDSRRKDADPVHESTVAGDSDLNDAMRRLEARSDVVRIAVEPA